MLCTGALAQAAATREVTDGAGRVVSLPRVVGRVADAWHANNALVLMLGGADKIVATTVQAQRQPWLRRLYPAIETVPAAFNAAGEVNMETLIGARPDVILTAYDGTLPKWAAAVEAYHVPVVLLPNTSLAALLETARITGQVLGGSAPVIAADYIRYFQDVIHRVTAVTAQIPATQRLKVLHTGTGGVLAIDGRQTIVDDWIKMAGGVNAADLDGLLRPVTLEQVVAWNPDVIIVGSAPNGASRQAILDDPRWHDIAAVRHGRVYANPSGAYLWDRHSAEAALQVLWAAKTLYPEKFTQVDMRKETADFYAKFFRYTLSAADIDSLLSATAP